MKRWFLALALLFPALAYGQGSNYQAIILGSTGRPVGGAQVTVCIASSPGVPCSPTVNIFQDQALTIAQSNPIITDAFGNFSFWAAPGTYEYTVTGLNVVAHGPFTVVLPCIVGASCASAGGLPNSSVAFSSTPSFAATTNASYSTTLTGNITAITITGTPINGNLLRFAFDQDATGGRTVIWPGNFVFTDDFAFRTMPLAKNKITFVYSGTNWHQLENIPDGAFDYYPVTFSATPTFSNSRAAVFDMTLSGNVTSSVFTTTGRAGTQFILNACQNGAGGWTFAFPGNVSNPQGFTFDTLATHCNRILYSWTGSLWIGIGGGSGGGGGTPGNPVNTLQKNSAGSFASTGVSEVGTTLSIDDDTNSKGPNPYFDIMRYGGYFEPSNAPLTASCSINSASTTLTCATNTSFQNGHGIVIPKAGLLPLTRNASFPAAPAVGTVTPLFVSAGSTTYTYCFVLEDYFGGLTACGSNGSTTLGAATLGVNTVPITGVVRASGLDTFTCSTNCNVQVNSQVQISGFTGGGNSLVNGTVVVNSLPDATHFTILANGLPDYTESASGTLSVKACNELFPSGLLTQESVILRTWIYRNGTLVGVSPGQDPYFQDCAQGVSGQPSYVPTSAPGAAQAGYLATTISSGGGTTTMTLAAAAGTTVSSVTATHSNDQALLAAYTAAVAAHGGVIRMPVIPAGGFNSFPFNATTNFQAVTNSTGSTVRLEVATATLNQPWVNPGAFAIEGIPQSSTSFEYSPLGVLSGPAHPLILANGTAGNGGVTISKVKLVTTQTGQSSFVSDHNLRAGGNVGFIFNDVAFSGNFASAIVLKGGFDFWFNRGTCAMTDVAGWAAHPCAEFTNASTYLSASGTQMPGRIYEDQMNFAGGTANQVDNYPLSNQPGPSSSGGGDIYITRNLHESNAGPHLRVAVGVGTSLGFGAVYKLNGVNFADQTNGLHQPLLELTGSPGTGGVILEGNQGAGQNPTILGGGPAATAPVCINNIFTVGCGATPNQSINGQNSINDGGTYGATNGGSMGYLMGTPAAPASCVVSAGGSVPIAVGIQYFIVATDRLNFSVNPFGGLTLLGPSCSVTTTSGQQTVTITRPTLPAGAVGWTLWRGGAEANIPSCTTALPASQLTFVDTFSFTCTFSAPSSNTAFTSGINSSGTTSANAFMSGWSMGQRTLTSGVTLGRNDATVFANTNAGSFAITLNTALTSQIHIIYNLSTGGNTLTIQTTSGNIDTASTTTIANGCAKMFTVDGTNAETLGTSCGSGGSGNVANANQYATPYYSAPGSANSIAGVAPATANSLYVTCHNVVASVGVPPSDCLPGIPVNSQTTSYTLTTSDRAGYIIFSSCTTPTLTLPAISGTTASNLPFRVFNGCSGNLTIAPTTQTISADGGGQVSSIIVFPNWWATVTEDSTPNWFAIRTASLAGYATGCTATNFNASTGIVCATLPVVSGVNSQTATYTAVAGDSGKIIVMDCSSCTLNLPASPPASPWGIFIENVNATSLTVNRNGLNIDKAASNLTLTQNQGVWVTHDGSNYFTSRGVGGGGGGGAVRWDQITDPSGNFLRLMGANLTEFDYTSALANAWKITNTTAATVTTPQSSPQFNVVCGQEWTGAGASTESCLRLQIIPATGLNVQPTVHYDLTTSSTNGNPAHIFSGKVYTSSTGAFDVGLQGSRLAAMDTSGFDSSCGARGHYFSTTANIDGGANAAGMGCLKANLITFNGPGINDELAIFVGANSQRQVASSYTNATTTPSTFQTWSLAASAHNYAYHCDLVYQSSASTATLALSFNASVAPTSLMGHARIFSTLTGTSTDATVTTTSSGNVAVLTGATPNATSTNYEATFSGTIEWGSSAGTFAIQAAAGGTGTVTILRGSACYLY